MSRIKHRSNLFTLLFIAVLSLPSFSQSVNFVEVFTEDFNPMKLDWPLNSTPTRTTSIENGKFNFNTTKGQERAAVLTKEMEFLIPDNYAIESDLYFKQGDGSGYGLVFNYSDIRNFHTFNISSNGYYRYGYYSDMVWTTVIGWTEVPLNGTGSINTLRIEFSDGDMLLMINGNRLYEMAKPEEIGTKLGFIVFGQQEIQVGRLSVFEDNKQLTISLNKNVQDKQDSAENDKTEEVVNVVESSMVSDYEHKYALVIGNSDYKQSPLKNPKNDAVAMGKELEKVGFKVTMVINADRSSFRQAIVNFSKDMNNSPGVGLFYYAGHGLQSNGVNYLVPIGAEIQAEFEIEDECIRADRVLRMLNNLNNPLNIIILDACRNNPYASAYRSGVRGLAMPEFAPTGSILAFATAPGKTASDGDGANGLYTQEFIEAMRIPGLSIEQVFKRVRINVSQKSEGEQIPWENSSLMGDFFFRKN